MIKGGFLPVLIVFSLLLCSCTSDRPPEADPAQGREEPEEVSPLGQAGVLLTGDNAVLRVFSDEPASDSAVFSLEQLPLEISSSSRVYPFGTYYLLRDGPEIKLYDEQFAVAAAQEFTKIGAVKALYPFIYVAADGSLIALDEKLESLSRVEFEFAIYFPGTKNVHHIIVQDQTAYLLDNTIDPLYIFTVDISSPGDITLLWEYEYEDINARLLTQWLEREKEDWAILHSSAYMTHFGHETNQGITLFKPGGDGSVYFNTYNEQHFYDDDIVEREGSFILADSATSPNWFITERDDSCYLATTAWVGERLVLEDKLMLDFVNPGERTRLAVDGSFLFIANAHEVVIFDISAEPEIIAREGLTDFGMEQVHSLKPLHPQGATLQD